MNVVGFKMNSSKEEKKNRLRACQFQWHHLGNSIGDGGVWKLKKMAVWASVKQ